MNDQRMRRWMIVSMAVVGWVSVSVRAEEFTFLHHLASGNTWAHLFDGGPIESGSDATSGPDDSLILFGATDVLPPGPFPRFNAWGHSGIKSSEDTLHVGVGTGVAYVQKGLLAGGPSPGGEGASVLSSVVDFIRPAGDIELSYALRITDMPDFQGHTSIVVENVTQSQTLLTLSDSDRSLSTVVMALGGSDGDLIRITSQMSAEGNTPGGPANRTTYDSDLGMGFRVVPEAGTLTLLALGSLPVLLRRRGCRDGRRG